MKVCVTARAFSKNETLVKELRDQFSCVKINESGERLSGHTLLDFIEGYDGIIVGLETINSEIIDSMEGVKVISKFGVGLDNIDVEYCEQKGIKIGWQGGVNRLSVAEMTLGFMLMLSRNLFLTTLQHREGVWNKNGGTDLSGKTIGIIGAGYIGKEVIRLLEPFNCNILINDLANLKTFYSQKVIRQCDKEEIYEKSDIISLHVPLTCKTRNMIDFDVFKKMKRSAFLINTARGEVVDLIALKKALKEKYIAGAALDVYYEEPPEDKELITLPNIICTPHIGGNSEEAVMAMGRSAIKGLTFES